MYTVKIYDFYGDLQHEIPQEDIIDVEFGEREIESEVALYRTPQRVVIKAVESSWLVNNIVKMPLANVADRNLSKFVVKIWYDDDKIGEYLILNENMSNIVDSLMVTLVCYDYSILLEVYSDMDIDVDSSSYYKIVSGGGTLGVLSLLLSNIYDKIDLFVTANEQTPINLIGSVDDKIATFDFSDKLIRRPSLQEGEIIAKDKGRTDYNYFGRKVRLGFSTNPRDDESSELLFALNVLETEEIYDDNAVFKVTSKGSYWTTRPLYRTTFTTVWYQFINITGLRKIYEETVATDWYHTKVDWTKDGGSFRRPTYDEWYTRNHGYDEYDNTSESWKRLVNLMYVAVSTLTGKYERTTNTFPPFSFLATQTKTFTDVYGGTFRWSGASNPTYPTPNELKSISVHRKGQIAPHFVKYSESTINALQAIRDLLYLRKQTIYVDSDGVMRIVNRDVVPAGSQNVYIDGDVELLSSNLYGVSVSSEEYSVDTLADADYSYLQGKIWEAYKNYRNRRELQAIVYGATPEVLDNVQISGFIGYLKSVKPDYRNQRHTVTMSVFDLSTLEFTVTDGVSPIVGAFIVLINFGWCGFTNAIGKLKFFNIPENSRIRYKIELFGYNTITSFINTTTVNDYTVNKQLSFIIPKKPEIELRSFNGVTYVNIGQQEGAAIYYTLDGSTPDDTSDVFEDTLKITEADGVSKVKAIAIVGDSDSSVASANVDVIPYERPDKDVEFISLGDKIKVLPRLEPRTLIRYTTDGSEPDVYSPILDGEINLENNINPALFVTKRFVSGVVESDSIRNYPKSLPILLEGECNLEDFKGSHQAVESIILPAQGLVNARITINSQIEHYQEGNIGLSLDAFHLYYAITQEWWLKYFKTHKDIEFGQINENLIDMGLTMYGGIAKYTDNNGEPNELSDSGEIGHTTAYPTFNAPSIESEPPDTVVKFKCQYYNIGHGFLANTDNVKLKYQIKIEMFNTIGERNWA